MNGKVMIDAGRGGRRACSGKLIAAEDTPTARIGRAVTAELERMGYETLFSGDVEELNSAGEDRGRPARCAAVSRRFGADCLLRLCVRAAELPSEGSATATVHRGDRRARGLAEVILRRLDRGSELNSDAVRTSSCVLLLRRTVCPSVILLLRLPFPQKESLSDADASWYGSCIAGGIAAWMRGQKNDSDCMIGKG